MSEQDRIEALEAENTLLSACLVKAEKQRDALLFALKYARCFVPQDTDTAYIDETIAAVESGKVPT